MQDKDSMSKHLPDNATWASRLDVSMVVVVILLFILLAWKSGASLTQASVLVILGACIIWLAHVGISVAEAIKRNRAKVGA